MDYINRETARTRMTNHAGVQAAPEEGVGEPLSVSHGVDPYRQSISLQAAARLARIAERRATIVRGSESEPSDMDGHFVRRLCKLVLGFAVGAALYAGIMYPFLVLVRSPLP
jgi:hypothetical protein